MNSLFISPHNDDEALFGAYTLIRERPLVLVVTDSYIQFERGDNITAEQRRNETLAAMEIVGCPVMFGGIRDTELNEDNCAKLLEQFFNFEYVYAPAIQGGNAQHDLIGIVAAQIFPNVIQYATYTKQNLTPQGNYEIVPTDEEKSIKSKALDCYESQLKLGATAPHFWAVRNKSEWLIR